jgi:hypothetical protein
LPGHLVLNLLLGDVPPVVVAPLAPLLLSVAEQLWQMRELPLRLLLLRGLIFKYLFLLQGVFEEVIEYLSVE